MGTYQGSTMGTTFTVKWIPPKDRETIHPDDVKSGIDSVLMSVNRSMSTWIEDSELSLFNRSEGLDWTPVSHSLVHVFQAARHVSEISDGAFDVTISPLVNQWGFGPDHRPQQIPSAALLDSLRPLVNYRLIGIQRDPPALKKERAGVTADVSGVAKGYGVDRVAWYLRRQGMDRYFVEIGGEVRTSGTNADDVAWRIGIVTPDSPRHIETVVGLSGTAVATSGDYQNYFEENGVRYSHTLDPRTGFPIKHRLASVTVVHDSCTLADAMATALNVLGPESGFQVAKENQLAVLFITRTDEGFETRMTKEFESFVLK
jgi:thiamine biosynthesis lipoprotein